jgi:hypothetical protein
MNFFLWFVKRWELRSVGGGWVSTAQPPFCSATYTGQGLISLRLVFPRFTAQWLLRPSRIHRRYISAEERQTLQWNCEVSFMSRVSRHHFYAVLRWCRCCLSSTLCYSCCKESPRMDTWLLEAWTFISLARRLVLCRSQMPSTAAPGKDRAHVLIGKKKYCSMWGDTGEFAVWLAGRDACLPNRQRINLLAIIKRQPWFRGACSFKPKEDRSFLSFLKVLFLTTLEVRRMYSVHFLWYSVRLSTESNRFPKRSGFSNIWYAITLRLAMLRILFQFRKISFTRAITVMQFQQKSTSFLGQPGQARYAPWWQVRSAVSRPPPGAQPDHSQMRKWGFAPKLKLPRIWLLYPSNAKVKNEWKFTSTSP